MSTGTYTVRDCDGKRMAWRRVSGPDPVTYFWFLNSRKNRTCANVAKRITAFCEKRSGLSLSQVWSPFSPMG